MSIQQTIQAAEGARTNGTGVLPVNGIAVAYTDQGQGTPLVLTHSSGASRRQWRSLIERLSGRYRVLAPDFHGHGDTPLPLEHRPITVDDDVAVIRALADLAGEPFHLVGHSYGAGVAMHAALELRERLVSLTLIEPAAFHLLRLEGEADAWREISSLARRHMSHVGKGELEACADEFMTYWIGGDAWQAMPPERRQAVIATMPGIAAIWRNQFLDVTGLATYGGITVPTLLMRARDTTLAASRVVSLLHRALPNNRLVEIDGGGHMAPLTNPEPVNAAIEVHVELEGIDALTRARLAAEPQPLVSAEVFDIRIATPPQLKLNNAPQFFGGPSDRPVLALALE